MASFRLLLLSFFVLSVSYRTTSAAVASSDSASKVSVALYYETLCPYSANFIVNYLAKIFENGLISIVDLELVPYGNARIRNGTISCQHGPYECLLNTVEACAIATWPDLNEHFSFIYCVEDLALKHKYLEWGSCFSKTGLDSLAVLECYDNDYGKKLELEYAAKTDALEPPHTYVPWVVVNGQPLYEEYEDVEAYICQAYTGETPNACTETSLITNRQNARTQVHVSFVDNISSRALNNERMIRTAA
ncbi:gamma-interferon-responsive lysosomal thiol protein-like [Zingiber officinale]|uniref:gamma-interferon-responsive lysosomal thiol protein-like n=1 Tax=Zingiber officinale TaxID=94328 RepID=UPI001C4ACF42|nr:gamma-interferon-responsive lysosomal thiol protein-like [Zingiber officinale]